MKRTRIRIRLADVPDVFCPLRLEQLPHSVRIRLSVADSRHCERREVPLGALSNVSKGKESQLETIHWHSVLPFRLLYSLPAYLIRPRTQRCCGLLRRHILKHFLLLFAKI